MCPWRGTPPDPTEVARGGFVLTCPFQPRGGEKVVACDASYAENCCRNPGSAKPGRTSYNARRRWELADSEIIFAVQESSDGGYEARALGHSIHTQADTMEELKAMLRDAVRCHFAPESRPHVIRLHLVKDEVIPV